MRAHYCSESCSGSCLIDISISLMNTNGVKCRDWPQSEYETPSHPRGTASGDFKAEWGGQLAGLMDPFPGRDDTRCPAPACVQCTLKSAFTGVRLQGHRADGASGLLTQAASRQEAGSQGSGDRKFLSSSANRTAQQGKGEPRSSAGPHPCPPDLGAEPRVRSALLLTYFPSGRAGTRRAFQ